MNWITRGCSARVRLLRSLGRTSTKVSSRLIGLSLGSLLCGIASPAVASPAVAEANLSSTPTAPSQATLQRLSEMFSPEIRATIGACQTRGGVNLAIGASPAGGVICGDGSVDSTVAYPTYLATVSDVLTAGGLLGVRSVIASDPRITPEMISAFLSYAQGSTMLRDSLQSALRQSPLFQVSTPESANLLIDEVLSRLEPTLQTTQNLSTLLGTQEQYQQVVNRFCQAPGMSVDQAKQTVPGLSSIQLYAICLQDSGLIDELNAAPSAPTNHSPSNQSPLPQEKPLHGSDPHK